MIYFINYLLLLRYQVISQVKIYMTQGVLIQCFFFLKLINNGNMFRIQFE